MFCYRLACATAACVLFMGVRFPEPKANSHEMHPQCGVGAGPAVRLSAPSTSSFSAAVARSFGRGIVIRLRCFCRGAPPSSCSVPPHPGSRALPLVYPPPSPPPSAPAARALCLGCWHGFGCRCLCWFVGVVWVRARRPTLQLLPLFLFPLRGPGPRSSYFLRLCVFCCVLPSPCIVLGSPPSPPLPPSLSSRGSRALPRVLARVRVWVFVFGFQCGF